MIYVLSGDRRDTQAWAISEGLKFVEVKHVQNSGSLPGVLSSKHRVVKLSSYANRRDHWSIDAKLRLINRREQVQIEEVAFDRLAPTEQVPLDELYDKAVENEAEEDFSAEDEPNPDAPETPDVAASDHVPAEQIEETPKFEEETKSPTPLDGPPADEKEKYPGVLEIGGALPTSPKFDPTPAQIELLDDVQQMSDDELREIGATEEDIGVLKPKTRRKKEQVAYDNAYAAYQENPSEATGSDLAAAHEALAKRFPNDPRLTEGSEDLDF